MPLVCRARACPLGGWGMPRFRGPRASACQPGPYQACAACTGDGQAVSDWAAGPGAPKSGCGPCRGLPACLHWVGHGVRPRPHHFMPCSSNCPNSMTRPCNGVGDQTWTLASRPGRQWAAGGRGLWGLWAWCWGLWGAGAPQWCGEAVWGVGAGPGMRAPWRCSQQGLGLGWQRPMRVTVSTQCAPPAAAAILCLLSGAFHAATHAA